MTLNPGIIALLLSTILTALMASYAALFGIKVLRRWDIRSGSEGQVLLERRTYLVGTLLGNVMFFEVLALFLFIQSAERMHTLFVGAMCAAGTLYVNPAGYPALILRVVLAAMCGLWLVLNRLDSRAPDYPLIRLKYAMLMVLAPVAVASAALNWMFLTGLKADVITSCCGSLFSQGSQSVRAEVALSGETLILYSYIAATALTLIAGALYWRGTNASAPTSGSIHGRAALSYGVLSALMLPVGILALMSCISPYIYELPTHHCPFCMLQSDYGYIGYLLYALLLAGSVLGMGAGAAGRLKGLATIEGGAGRAARTLTLGSLVAFALFTIIVIWSVASSNLTM